jgi:hypothetical protein
MKKYLRISRARFDPKKADEVSALLVEVQRLIWPKQEKLPGYIEGHVGLDRENGAMIWATFWDSAEHGEALGSVPEMIASGEKFRAHGLVFEPITTHELM